MLTLSKITYGTATSLGKLVLKMQSSITMFFKAKQPPKVDTEDNPVDTLKDGTGIKTPQKRPHEDDDNDHANGDAKKDTPSEPKRVAVESPTNGSTPVKKELNSATGDKTPPRQQNLMPSTPCQTPLINFDIVVRKKISAGAYALHENIGHSWFRALQKEFEKPYFKKLSQFVQEERQRETVFPPADKVYSWTHYHEIRETRVVILGQDPYHGPNQAHGLCFSVQRGVSVPPSLINIYKELENDIPGFKSPNHGELIGWAKQGVLMLNTCLTVRKNQANSHRGKGWESFTDSVITWISKNVNHKVVFLLWGRPAQKKTSLIDKRHKILISAHPSPLSAHNGWFGCKHFSQTNAFLRSQKLPEVDWKSL